MSTFAANRIAVHLAPKAVRAVRRGEPWVFAESIDRQKGEARAGDLAVLFDEKRKFVGIGLYDPESPIRVRTLHVGEPTTVDEAWLRGRLAASVERRATLLADPQTDGYRLVHGENDGIPGLVVDRYGETLVIKLDTVAWPPHLELLQAMLLDLSMAKRIVLRLSRTVAGSAVCPPELVDGCVVHGPTLDGSVLFRENGIVFEVDPIAGQKTGFFLDQRDNRACVERLSRGKSVLNVFSYTGGFSLYAARGGASTVISLDMSAPALAAAEANFAHNRGDSRIATVPHETLCADAFEGLRELAEAGRQFGLVILDPPSFTHRQADVERAVSAYRRLAVLGLSVLAPKGILVAASCSARVTADAFFKAVYDAAGQSRRPLQEIERTAHAIDHPIGFPQGAYLKCLYARA